MQGSVLDKGPPKRYPDGRRDGCARPGKRRQAAVSVELPIARQCQSKPSLLFHSADAVPASQVHATFSVQENQNRTLFQAEPMRSLHRRVSCFNGESTRLGKISRDCARTHQELFGHCSLEGSKATHPDARDAFCVDLLRKNLAVEAPHICFIYRAQDYRMYRWQVNFLFPPSLSLPAPATLLGDVSFRSTLD